MDPIAALILIVVGVGILLSIPIVVLCYREIKKTYAFFSALAARYLGRTRKVPMGAIFSVAEGIEVKVYALQGSIYYEVPITLMEDPGVLLIRRFSFLKSLTKLHYSPGRQQISFSEPVDEFYTFQAKNVDFIHEIFTDKTRDRLRMEGRVVRLEIKQKKMIARIMLWKWTPQEQELAFQSVEILNGILSRVLRSRLAVST